jgi:hypothetical protein
MTIQVTAQNNATFARSLVLAMPGYALPLALSSNAYFLAQLRSTQDPTQAAFQQIALVFDSRQNSIGVVADDTVANTVTLALLAPAQAMAQLNPAETYFADLLYVSGGDVAYFGTLQFAISQGVTLGYFGTPPSFASIASWPPLTDIAGASPATVLSIQTQGLPGPIPWGAAAPWAADTVYQSNPPASVVTNALSVWLCTTSHTSGAAFDPSKWLALVDSTGLQAAATTAAASASAAAASAANAATSQTAAAASAAIAATAAASSAAATTEAGIATTQAAAASASATASATSAATATAEAAAASASATAAAASAALAASFGGLTPAALGAALTTWFATLPTSLPASAGQWWNNGGTLAQS